MNLKKLFAAAKKAIPVLIVVAPDVIRAVKEVKKAARKRKV